ncbi:MarR family winged helix-turn-helix transcriptional regulator [Actinomadura nitritigenes]|uniref:MarR family winged helix-turn-helix transcriptional regulator n=1 Tax=Actinomadura nitritigenes TaxID=134602 RepID=UPI003D8DB4C1
MTSGRTDGEPAVPLIPGRMERHTGCMVLKIGQVIFRLMEAQLASLGLRIRHYSVLGALKDHGPTSQQDLGTYLRIDSATMVATIDDLEKLDFVNRRRRPEDRRSYIISITPDGEAKLDEIEALMDKLDEEYFADLTLRQHEQLHNMARKLSRGKTLVTAYDRIRGN